MPPSVYIFAQIIGFSATALALFVYSFRDRKKVLASKLTANAMWSVHYFLIGQYPTAVINLLNCVRESVFYNRGRYKWASGIYIPITFLLLTVGAFFINKNGEPSAVSLLPVCGSSIAVIGLWCKRLIILRLINFPALTLWLIYAIIIGSPASILCNALSLLSIVIGLVWDIGELRRKHKA